MAPPINPNFPVIALRSIDELMGIAVAMEAEAARRYDQLARRVLGRGQPELAELFRQLAALERDHERGLEAWAQREGRPRPIAAEFAWQLPETFGGEADERPLDPYQALAIAVRNEERAFTFYAYLSALCAGRQDLSARAEALAREELKHVAMLRSLRRRAFHARETRPDAVRVASLAELEALAAGLEAGSAEIDLLAANALSGTPAAAMLTRWHAGATPPPAPPTRRASETMEAARRSGVLAPDALTAEGVVSLALRNAQEVVDVYLTIAEANPDAAVMDAAQRMAEQAMARLALIRQLKDAKRR